MYLCQFGDVFYWHKIPFQEWGVGVHADIVSALYLTNLHGKLFPASDHFYFKFLENEIIYSC